MQLIETRQIDAPVEVVFRLLTEPEQARRWMPTLESTETVSQPSDGSVVGTRFRHHIRNASAPTDHARSTVSTYEGVITEYDPPDHFSVRLGNKVILIESRYELSRGPGDSTNLRCVTETRVTHWLLRWFGGLMNKMMRLGLTQHLEMLKRVAESDVP